MGGSRSSRHALTVSLAEDRPQNEMHRAARIQVSPRGDDLAVRSSGSDRRI